MKLFVKIREAAEITGLSQYFIRRGCRDGTIPCITSGSTFYVNMQAFLRILEVSEKQRERGEIEMGTP